MKLNYKKLLKQIDESGACERQFKPLAYFIENKKYTQAREILCYHSNYWLPANEILDHGYRHLTWRERFSRFRVKVILCYDRRGSATTIGIEDGGYLGKVKRFNKEDMPKKYIIPEDYKYTRINGTII